MPGIAVIILILVVIMAFGCFQIYQTNRRENLLSESWIVLQEEGYEAYSERLDSSEIRRFLSSRKKKLLLLNAAINTDRDDKVRELVSQLNHTPMSSREYVSYNMTVLGYAVEKKDLEMGAVARDALHKPLIRKKIIAEADQVYDIYLLHKTDYIDELLQFSKRCRSNSGKAMAYYRIAKQYYYLEDMENCKRYISLASEAFPNNAWRESMNKVVESNYEELG